MGPEPSPFGDGKAAERIAAILAGKMPTPFDPGDSAPLRASTVPAK